MLKTFGAVLAIARLEAATAAPDQSEFDASELAADVAELYEPLCEEKGLDFKAEVTPHLTARGNREFIAQALANLLDNAVKYTPAGGSILLRVRRRSSSAGEDAGRRSTTIGGKWARMERPGRVCDADRVGF